MRIVRDFEHCPDECKNSVVALGNFDGVHRGHRAIIETCIAEAKRSNRKAAIMTFEPHPREFFTRGESKLRLYSFRRKMEAFAQWDAVATVFIARFNARLAALTAEAFAHDLLKAQLGVAHIVTGHDFAFGKGRQGNTALLAQTFGFTAVAPVSDETGAPVSSSRIRAALAEGKPHEAEALLGRPYTISGHVRSGEQRGRTLGFPTANLSLNRLFVPRLGIYAARATLGGNTYDAVASIGTKPTFTATKPLLEVHCFDFARQCYGERMQVELVSFIRDEQKFDDAAALRARMEDDALAAKSILSKNRGMPYAHCS